MKTGFTPIRLHDHVESRLRANPDIERADLIQQAGIRRWRLPLWHAVSVRSTDLVARA